MDDKHGTLTLGRPAAVNLDASDPVDGPLLLARAQASRHPPSEVLTRRLVARGVHAETVEIVGATPGFGVAARWHGHSVTLGRPQRPLAGDALASELAVDDDPMALLRFAAALPPAARQGLAPLLRGRPAPHHI